jgi:hypothetical protein
MTNREKYLDFIVRSLSALQSEVASQAKLGRTNLNKDCENLVKELFNRIYKLSLENLNEKSNFPGLDIGDKTKRIAYQITSQKNSKKVDHTLRICIDQRHYTDYRDIYIFMLATKQRSYTLKTITQPYFEFDPAIHIIDFNNVFQAIGDLDIDTLEDIYQYVGKELPYYMDALQKEKVKVSAHNLHFNTRKLIGREKELAMLDTAWETPRCNIVVLKATGGSGKTALTEYWLTRHLQPQNYNGAKWVFSWSFYNQGGDNNNHNVGC